MEEGRVTVTDVPTHKQKTGETLLEVENLSVEFRTDAGVVQATRLLQRSQGRLRIDLLCRELETSRATLGRKFSEQVGLAPKTYARVVRIEALMQHLGTTQPDDWAAVAADFGYHDQAHLNHDFQEFCGHSPNEYLRHAAPGGGATIENPPA